MFVYNEQSSGKWKNIKERIMANRKIWLGILVMALVFGMTVVGCSNGSTGGGESKSITITGITGKTGDASIGFYSSLDSEDEFVGGWGMGTISGNSVTFKLLNKGSFTTPWTGSGSYYLELSFYQDDDTNYYYTDGQTWAQLGLTQDSSVSQVSSKLPKYTISSATSTIAFNKFTESSW